MADEMTVPLLPRASIDETTEFYAALGFRTTFRQVRPNPYAAMQRGDLHLHFFGIPGFDPADSYGTCLVVVPDIGKLHREFAAGLRTRYGRVPLSGIPRMTRPRPRKNNDGVTGFSVIDPGGNWIRISTTAPRSTPDAPGRLATTMANAVVLADSHGDPRQAARILDTALRKAGTSEDPAVLAEALIYRAELATTLDDPATVRETLTKLSEMDLTVEQREQIAELPAGRP
ncbi:bleomycin resistance protein [Actinoplanes sp. GCM10030250]|uniref:bleomycin resistance protein n=1 Tax=Actinoplanes sp. GCM10030250 TaxID=3273376 RepID=UPI00360FA874